MCVASLLSFALLCAVPEPATRSVADAVSVETVLQLYEASLRSLHSFDVYLTVEERIVLDRSRSEATEQVMRRPDPGAPLPVPRYEKVDHRFHHQSRQYLLGDMFRFDCLRDREREYSPGNFTRVWDGNALRNYSEARKTARIEGYASDSNLIGAASPPYVLLFKTAFGDYDYATLIRDRESTLEQTGAGYLIDARPATAQPVNANIYGVRIVFEEQQGYMPGRIEWYIERQGRFAVANSIENELDEVQPGLWLPTSSRITFFLNEPRSEHAGEAYGTMEIAVDRARSAFNIPIDEQTFQLEFPVGTAVKDGIRNMTYVVGAEDQEDVLDELAAQGRLGAERLLKPRLIRPGSSRRVLFWANIALLVLFVSALAWRRYRSP